MIKIYFISAPFNTPNTGDYDYMKSLCKEINNLYGDYIKTEIIMNGKLITNMDKIRNLYLENLTKSVSNKSKFENGLKIIRENELRKTTVNHIFNHINKENYKIKIISLQYRAPETGALFYPEDIEKFKKNNIFMTITCHEFYLNIVRPYLKIMTINVLNSSNLTYFFNKIDYKDSVKFGFEGKYENTLVIPTTDIEIDYNITKLLNRENNILFFGLIRPKKGFESIIKMIKILQNKKYQNINKIIIAGKFEKNNPLVINWFNRIKNDIFDDNFNVNLKYKSIVEVIFNPTNNELKKLIEKSKYAYKPDGKGFANNSSSILNLLSFGCIVYAKWGLYTPEILTNPNSKYYLGIRFQNKINNNLMNNSVPSAKYVLENINNSSNKFNTLTLTRAKLILDEIYNKKIITNKFIKNLINNIKDFYL
jgi:glycosyltransferase involved in cell wall biosynthesis